MQLLLLNLHNEPLIRRLTAPFAKSALLYDVGKLSFVFNNTALKLRKIGS